MTQTTGTEATDARERHAWHRIRLERDALAQSQRLAAGVPAVAEAEHDKRSVIGAALARARAARAV